MPDSTATQHRHVPFRVTDPERIPAPRYYDAAFFELERQHLWPHVWQMACRLEEIPHVGDWVEYTILDDSVIVVRTDTGIKAFHNACRHRGVQFAKGQGNCAARGFICPFHGWRWNMNGENTFVFGQHLFTEHNLRAAELALVPCRVELWGGCAFINFDTAAPALVDCLGPVADAMNARNVEKFKVDWWRSSILPVNWKLAMEAFMEGYHVMRTHPQLHAVGGATFDVYGRDKEEPVRDWSAQKTVDSIIESLTRIGEGMGGMVSAGEIAIAGSLRDMEWPAEPREAAKLFYARLMNEITRQGRARGVPVPDLKQVISRYPIRGVEFIFPHYFLLPMFGAMASYRIRPLSAETCLFELWALELRPDGEEREAPTAPIPVPHDDPSYPPIPLQDYTNLPMQQRGLHARGFEYMRLARGIEGMISNYQRLIDGYLAGADPAALAAATRRVNGGMEGRLVDELGLSP